MGNVELQHSVNRGVHTFVDGDVRLVASRSSATNTAMCAHTLRPSLGVAALAGSSNITLTDQESREKFDYYARKQQPDIHGWNTSHRSNQVLLGWLDDSPHGKVRQRRHHRRLWRLAQREKFPEVHPVIQGILMRGTVLMAGKPKVRQKSSRALPEPIGRPGGLGAWKHTVEQGDVLYLSLEDHKRRLQKRLKEMLSNDSTAPARGTFQFSTKWPTIDSGGVEAIDEWLSLHPNAKLVVVDTFVKVRGRAKTRDVYKEDYDAAAPLTALAAKYPHVCILIIHHCSKRSDAEDFFDRFQNSTGLTAAVEGGMELCRTRGSTDCTLEIAHKDIEIDTKHAITHDPHGGWMLLGDAKTVLLSEERQSVVDLLLEAGKPMHYKAIAVDLGKKEGTTKKLVWEMARDHQLIPTGGGHYDISPTLLASILSNESSVRGNQSNQRNQGNQSNQVTRDDGYRGYRRLLSMVTK